MTTVGPVTEDRRAPGTDPADDDEMPRVRFTRRSLAVAIIFVLAAIAFLYWGLPRLAGLKSTWHRIEEGDPWWLALALLFTCLSFGGYVLLFLGVYVRAGSRIDWRTSYLITMAGLAATRVFAAGGAGGLALTAWALRRAGVPARQVATSTVAFLVLTYVVYMFALIVFGLGLYLGIFPGPAPFALTVIPAIFAIVALTVGGLVALVPTDFERRLRSWSERGGRIAHLAQRVATVPASASGGIREAISHLRTADPALLGAVAYWGFNIAVLWAAFHAFGEPPPTAVLITGYFVGMFGNLLPLPGGVGGVDGGMIGAFAAFGVDFGLATVAVLTYRAFAFWLPTIPGAIAYLQLRHKVGTWRREPVAVTSGSSHYTL
jgi:uncharacterized protein (TIRG00374 family)